MAVTELCVADVCEAVAHLDDDDDDGCGNDDDGGVSSPLKKKASASTRPFAILMSILELVGLAIYIWRKR